MKLAAAAVVVTLIAVNCAATSERALLDQFFVASRLRDRTALARFSTVVFEPRTDGIVEEFVVKAVTGERQLDDERSPGGAGALPAERQRIASLSLADPTDPADLTRRQLVFVEKVVTVAARVGVADGITANRSIVLTLQRARVAGEQARAGRWIVVRFVY